MILDNPLPPGPLEDSLHTKQVSTTVLHTVPLWILHNPSELQKTRAVEQDQVSQTRTRSLLVSEVSTFHMSVCLCEVWK